MQQTGSAYGTEANTYGTEANSFGGKTNLKKIQLV